MPTTSQIIVADQNRFEDALAHLRRSSIVEYRTRQFIYHQHEPSTCIYLVIEGAVKVARVGNDGSQTVINIYRADEFFGESALLGLPHRAEQAIALEDSRLMSWTVAEIHKAAEGQPKLAIALLQIVLQRSIEYERRIESLATETTDRRLARTLIRLSHRAGTLQTDGSHRMAPLTHELLGQYVGTSREIVSHYMNLFRRQGYVRYSRKEIALFRDLLEDWLVRTSSHAVATMQARYPETGRPLEPAFLQRA